MLPARWTEIRLRAIGEEEREIEMCEVERLPQQL
jgi:hypothetical protein